MAKVVIHASSLSAYCNIEKYLTICFKHSITIARVSAYLSLYFVISQPLSRKVAVRQSVTNVSPSGPGNNSSGKTRLSSRSAIDRETLPGVTMATVPQPDQYLPTEGVQPNDTIEMSFQVKMEEWTHKAEVRSCTAKPFLNHAI